ncbi:hypothetical protein L218DRAFT_182497 [Marasmius fiardii PR-910]|nr:hypothetical protein L218DRAFT_182497 [Marasmius fiardii PR-910]
MVQGERYLGDHEIVDHIVHNPTSTICWTVHKPLKGWYIRIRSPTFPPGVFIPLIPLSPNSPHYAQGALTFRSRTSIPSVKDAETPTQRSTSTAKDTSTSTVHSYPPTPPTVPSLVLQPASPPSSPPVSTSKLLSDPPTKISWSSTSINDFVIAPCLPAATSPSLFSRIVSAIRDNETLGSNSFTISRIAVQAPPPYVSISAGNDPSSSSNPTSVKCLPLLTFRDRTSLLTARSMNGILEMDQTEERLLGVDSAFWITVALTYLDFVNDKASYLAALND